MVLAITNVIMTYYYDVRGCIDISLANAYRKSFTSKGQTRVAQRNIKENANRNCNQNRKFGISSHQKVNVFEVIKR